MRALAVTALVLFTIACGSKKDPPAAGSAEPPKGSTEPPKADPGSAAAGTGSAPGSAAAGSGSADVGSAAGSDAGSGSAIAAGSGSADTGFNFDKLTHDQKMDFMKKQVVPKMKPMFQKFDAKEFANFGCKTCHGKDPAKTKYEMPSKDVPALDFAALKAGKQKPEMAKWMSDVVKPEMAKLLNEPEYSDTNPKGFGCTHCHTVKK
ncbi:MAG: hypothetical protein H0V17_30045 [Deltaproteobacteria bacterium]|nr:hypothetical protein [Deltaproteobacteria bacterium]